MSNGFGEAEKQALGFTWSTHGQSVRLRSQPIREEDRCPSTNDRAGFGVRSAWGSELADGRKQKPNVKKKAEFEKSLSASLNRICLA